MRNRLARLLDRVRVALVVMVKQARRYAKFLAVYETVFPRLDRRAFRVAGALHRYSHIHAEKPLCMTGDPGDLAVIAADYVTDLFHFAAAYGVSPEEIFQLALRQWDIEAPDEAVPSYPA